MSELTPEWHFYQPPENYIVDAAVLLDVIFASPAPPPEEKIEVPEAVMLRSWRKDDALFWARCVDPRYALVTSDDRNDAQVTVMKVKLTPSEEGFIEVRSYVYFQDTAELQVADWPFTAEEFEALDFKSPEGRKRGEAMREGFDQLVYTASAVDYNDFLADLDGFRESYVI